MTPIRENFIRLLQESDSEHRLVITTVLRIAREEALDATTLLWVIEKMCLTGMTWQEAFHVLDIQILPE